MTSLLDIGRLAKSQIVELLDSAASLRDVHPNRDQLTGSSIALLFFEPSTRTRISFELAGRSLGADVVSYSPETSSAKKGESDRDTVLTLAAMGVDMMVVRHPSVGFGNKVAEWTGLPVINGGDGRGSHPTQTLADLLTLRDRFGRIDGLSVGLVGDIVNSRVARGSISALPLLGADLTLIGPQGLLPRNPIPGVRTSTDLDSKLGELDVVYLLRVQKERGGGSYYPSDAEYHHRFGLTAERALNMKPDAVVMHPGPINRGVELEGGVADGPSSLILDQVANGIPVRMAAILRSMAAIS